MKKERANEIGPVEKEGEHRESREEYKSRGKIFRCMRSVVES